MAKRPYCEQFPVVHFLLALTTHQPHTNRIQQRKTWQRFREIPEWIETATKTRAISPATAIAELEAMCEVPSNLHLLGTSALSKVLSDQRKAAATVSIIPSSINRSPTSLSYSPLLHPHPCKPHQTHRPSKPNYQISRHHHCRKSVVLQQLEDEGSRRRVGRANTFFFGAPPTRFMLLSDFLLDQMTFPVTITFDLAYIISYSVQFS